MTVPHSTTSELASTAVLIPLRSLVDGKARLADLVGPTERCILIESMARTVVAAAHELDVLVVHDDPAVADWAAEAGAASLRPDRPGLNYAVSFGRDHLAANGYERVIIAHADLPLVEDLRVMCTEHVISIAPDRTCEGTNVMALPTTLDFTFAYGAHSFAKHVDFARSIGFEPHIIEDDALAWDLDEPNDMTRDSVALFPKLYSLTQKDHRGADN